MLHNACKLRLASNALRTIVITAALLRCGVCIAAAQPPTLSATVINGANAYSPTDLFAVYQDQLGRPITNASAQAIITQIEAMYLRDGYSRPEFRLDGDLAGAGVLRIEVFEAQVTQVEFRGDAGPYAQRLQAIATELRAKAPLPTAALKSALQTMRGMPGLTVNASTHRAEHRRNTYILKIETVYKPFDVVVQLNNRGTQQIGRNFAFGQLVGNNLLGLEERIGLLFSAANDYQEYHGAGLFFDAPVSRRGAHLTLTTFASRSDPTETPDRNDRYLRERSALRLIRPIDAAGQSTVALSAGIDVDDLDILRNGQRLRNERLRVVEAGARASGRISAKNQYLFALQVRQGVDGLGSELEAKDLRLDPRRLDFLLLRLQYTQLLQFADRWTVRIDAFGQHSAYVLPDAERYKIGGERLGRGFEMTQIAGDQGAGAKAELRRELSGVASAFGKTSIYGFYDFGAVWKQDLRGRESATSAGVGLALDFGRLGGFVELAKPLTHADIEGDRGVKFFAEIRLRM